MGDYTQSTEYSGAAAALLIVINQLKPSHKLTKLNEFKIWLYSVNLPTRACSIYGLASYALTKGVKCSIMVGKQEYDFPDYRFKGYKKDDIEIAKYTEDIHLHKFKELGGILEEKAITIAKVKQMLKSNRILILRTDAGSFRDLRPSSNYIVVTGFRNKSFEIHDPYQGKINLRETQIVQCFEDLVVKRKRDPRMIIFSK